MGAYFHKVKVKQNAVQEILSVTDYKDFLEKSGYTDQAKR